MYYKILSRRCADIPARVCVCVFYITRIRQRDFHLSRRAGSKNLQGEISIYLSTPVTLSQIWNGQNLAAEIH